MAARILVTGATGYIGRALHEHLHGKGHDILGAVRSAAITPGFVQAPNLSAESDWSEALAGRDVVVHTAARAHVLKETEIDSLAVFREVNTAGTLSLASQAAAAGARRFVFISSIGVNGMSTSEGESFTEQSPPAPHNHYALSKWEAEQGLWRIARETGMEVVILRPPLVYGPGVKGNFLRLMQFIDSGLPLPLGRCHNRRSLIGLTNLVDLLAQCLTNPTAAGQTFLVSDGRDLSTPELLQCVAQGFGKQARLFPVPTGWLRFVADLAGRTSDYLSLCGSLQVDISKVRRVLGWEPPQTLDTEIIRTVQWYLSLRHAC